MIPTEAKPRANSFAPVAYTTMSQTMPDNPPEGVPEQSKAGTAQALGPPRATLLRSRLALTVLLVLALALMLLGYRNPTDEGFIDAAGPDRLICDAASVWQKKYADDHGLQIVRIQVAFPGSKRTFVKAEGVVAVPVAVELPDAQEVLEIKGYPPPLKVIKTDGVTNMVWAYPGRSVRDLRYTALALVRRAPLTAVPNPVSPSFTKLPLRRLSHALLDAQHLGEHALHGCSLFRRWAGRIAGPPPHTDRLLRMTRYVSRGLGPDRVRETERANVCRAIRRNVFTEHEAHVAVVMAARQLKIPAYGFISAAGATTRPQKLVGTFIDGLGWVTLELTEPDRGYTLGGPALLTRAPPALDPPLALDRYWNAAAAAYAPLPRLLPSPGAVRPFAATAFGYKRQNGNVTSARSVPLVKACP